jgi:hypothetical protein
VPDRDHAIARYDEWVARVVKSPEVARARARRLERRTRAMGRRMKRMALGGFAVLFLALLYGLFIGPLGFAGLMATAMLAMCVVVLLSTWPKSPDPTLEALPQSDLAQLPAQIEDWLDVQRRALPAPAAREVDRIMVQLDQLAPQLAKLDPGSAMAEDARRLMSDHLPRLVRSYADVPAQHRAGTEATARFREGLRVVGEEIDRMTTTIARDSLDALEVEGRFLEQRYQPQKRIEGTK